MGPMIRAASLRGFAPLVAELGGDPERLLERFGLSGTAIAADDGLVPITAHDLMLDAAAAELGCPDLGLRLADRQDLSVLGPLALAIQASATVAEALECASRFLFVHSPALSIGLDEDPHGRPGIVALTYRKDLSESTYSRQGIELGLGLLFRIATALVGARIGLRTVELPHRPLSPVRRYTDFFGTDVKFDRPAAVLRLERRILDEGFAGADDAIRAHAVQVLADDFPDPGARVAPRVRRVLAESLTASPTTGHVARLLALHPRTLQRRLAAEGTTVETLLDDVRREAAHRLITTTDLPLGRVATLVGFAEQSSLSRAVRGWHATTPGRLRALSR